MTAAPDILAALLVIALKVTLVLGAAALLDTVVLGRRASAAARHLLWSLATAAALLLPLFTLLLPAIRVAIPRPAAIATPAQAQREHPLALTPTSPIRMEATTPVVETSRATFTSPAVATSEAPPRRDVPWTIIVLALYALGAGALLARVARDQLAVRRLVRRGRPVDDAAWTALLARVAASFGIRRRVALLYSDDATLPLTCGVVRPFVLVPSSADAWPAERREAVLLHELAHVARHDCLTQALGAVASAAYWPHPGIWWATARLREQRELACDDEVLARRVPPRAYAGILLDLARAHRPHADAPSLALSMAHPSQLESRIRAAIAEGRPRNRPGRTIILAGIACSFAVAMPTAALSARAAERVVVRAKPVVVTPAVETPPVVARDSAAPPSADSGAVQVPQGVPAGQWTMRMATRAEAESDSPALFVAMRAPGLNTFVVPLRALDGLGAAQIAGTQADVRFTLRRDAGAFTFTGGFANGRGEGSFEFVPSASFADALVKRGMRRPRLDEQLSLARHDVPLAFLDELASHGYAQPSTATLVHAGLTSADARYLRAMSALGYRAGTLEGLIRWWNVSVTPEFVQDMNARAGRRLTIEELMDLRNHGGLPTPAVPASTPPASAPASTPVVAGNTPLAGRWVLGDPRSPWVSIELQWDDDTQWRRYYLLSEFDRLSWGDINSGAPVPVLFRKDQDAGRFEFDGMVGAGKGSGQLRFTPNRAFAATLRAIGVQGAEMVTDHSLKNLAFGTMAADSIRQFIAMGLGPLSLREIVDMSIRQVTPGYARAMRELGIPEAGTVRGITELRFAGITPEYVRALAELGYRELSSRDVIALKNGDITPAFIRSAQAKGEAHLTIQELMAKRAEERMRTRRQQ